MSLAYPYFSNGFAAVDGGMMSNKILYDCGCYASGDNVPNKCYIHGCGGKFVSFESSNSISVMKSVCASCDQLRRRNAELEAENEDLKSWKESALEVEKGWNAQAVGKLLGVKLGQDIRKNIQPKIEHLQARNAELERELATIKKFNNRWHEIADEFRGKKTDTHLGDKICTIGWQRDELLRRNAELEAENERLRKNYNLLKLKCSKIEEYLNLIFIELYGFAGAAIHGNGLATLRSLRRFLEDSEGLSDEYIENELTRNGIDPESLLKRVSDMIKNAKAKSDLRKVDNCENNK